MGKSLRSPSTAYILGRSFDRYTSRRARQPSCQPKQFRGTGTPEKRDSTKSMVGDRERHRGPAPVVYAVLVCDYTIRDGETGKVSIIGIFDKLMAAQFPALHAGLFVYVNMADAEGDYTMGLELLRSDTMKRLGYGEQRVTYVDRLAGAELVFDLRGLIFAEPGKYEFRVYANGAHIGGKPFHVVQLKAGGEE